MHVGCFTHIPKYEYVWRKRRRVGGWEREREREREEC